jgi:hypothetical protein
MPELRRHLSGDVIQAINPWNWIFRPRMSQFGLINVSLGNSRNLQIEQEILSEVGTYGRQLGRVGDVLRILVKNVNRKELSPDEQYHIDALVHQLDEIDRIKGRAARS